MRPSDKGFLRGVPIAIVLWLLLIYGIKAAFAQGIGPNPVTTYPYMGATTYNASSTVAVSNTFQSVFPTLISTNQHRVSCILQNNSAANSMFVFFGPIASATLTNSIKLSPGTSVSCVAGGMALQDQVSVTGTAGDAFYAAQQ
jgi:hypothetical protein